MNIESYEIAGMLLLAGLVLSLLIIVRNKRKKIKQQVVKEIVETPEVRKLLERMNVIGEWIRQEQTKYNFGEISKEQYDQEFLEFEKELAAIEYLINGKVEAVNQKVFDDLMGNPIQWLNEIMGSYTYDKKVHDAIEEVENGRRL